MKRFPPLNAVRVFEVAARHLSFRKAAEELHVTPGAVSQQIQSLEEHLGVALFERLPRALKLTAQGQQFVPAVTQSLQLLVDATSRLRSDRQVINVSVAPSFCTRWLIPRLGRFCEAYPHIEVRIDAGARLVDLAEGAFDLAIRYTPRRYPDLHYTPLFPDLAFPVCAPALAARLGGAIDLRGATLLHWSTHDQWDRWLQAANVRVADGASGLFFSHLMLALDAAISGQGVALSSMPLVGIDLEAGRLVNPFGPVVDTGFEYVAVSRAGTSGTPQARAFADWLAAEAVAMRQPWTARAQRP